MDRQVSHRNPRVPIVPLSVSTLSTLQRYLDQQVDREILEPLCCSLLATSMTVDITVTNTNVFLYKTGK